MFQLRNRDTGARQTIYAVHKSGPRNEQTKFLVYEGDWCWAWANQFEPMLAGEGKDRSLGYRRVPKVLAGRRAS